MSNVSQNTLTLKGYFQNIWTAVRTTVKGMSITFKYVYGVKPVTIEYPEVKKFFQRTQDLVYIMTLKTVSLVCNVQLLVRLIVSTLRQSKETRKHQSLRQLAVILFVLTLLNTQLTQLFVVIVVYVQQFVLLSV